MTESDQILDQSLIKDLSNHIYEKRKATAFQIESLTKSALSKNDSQKIYKIIKELTELTLSSSNSSKMGAITALGSVSVALGSFAIAYFLKDIIKPIFATFKDTDARVRYYSCESLYNVAKIARGEILLYFNETFDILCILVSDSESSVKNAADILDRLIKDIVSAKATNYVSILHQQGEDNGVISNLIDANGNSIQINQSQDPSKAFSLPKFIPTLLERMYTIDPFTKKFLLSWLELFDDIPSLELISFLPNFLDPLIKFLFNDSSNDIRLETENLLNIFLKEIKQITNIKIELRRKRRKGEEVNDDQSIKSDDTTVFTKKDESNEVVFGQEIFIDHPKIINILLQFLRDQEIEYDSEIYHQVQAISLKWLKEILEISPTGILKQFNECVAIILKNVSKLNNEGNHIELRDNFLQFNLQLQKFLYKFDDGNNVEFNELYGLSKDIGDEFNDVQLPLTLQSIIKEYLNHQTNELSRITSLEWLIFIYSRSPQQFLKFFQEQNEKSRFQIIDLLKYDTSNDVILKVLQLLSIISESNKEFFKNFIINLIKLFEIEGQEKSLKVEFIIRKLCVTLNSEIIFTTFSDVLMNANDLDFEFKNNMITVLNNILMTTTELSPFRKKLKSIDIESNEADFELVLNLFNSWCYNIVSLISLSLFTGLYKLSYLIIVNLQDLELNSDILIQLDVLIQLIESSLFLKLRLRILEPKQNPFLIKSLYGLLMILPQSSTFMSLKNRLNSINYNFDNVDENINKKTDKETKLLNIFKDALDKYN
ncbi:unnamed protein product [Candida verbasci]|uniref:Vacuolar protein 14 C-terminal Fig4-binding domain-containing protein n=1 Tax=Candida verbasci TaxID=1227364 RepID=A0A9W4TPS9_9ASCO|nr:unnamed protein product [Candida verbasci]